MDIDDPDIDNLDLNLGYFVEPMLERVMDFFEIMRLKGMLERIYIGLEASKAHFLHQKQLHAAILWLKNTDINTENQYKMMNYLMESTNPELAPQSLILTKSPRIMG